MLDVTADPVRRPPPARKIAAWAGVAPFFLFAAMFLIVPTFSLMVGAFQNRDGEFTFDNILRLTQPSILHSYALSLEVSAASAFFGALIGFALAAAVIFGGLPRWMRPVLMTFSGVASNFAGVPLAFAFVATLGRMGLVTLLLRNVFDFNLYTSGFNLFTFTGLTLTYLYFQIPLMALVIAPALDGMKQEWREAAEILGASRWQYRRVAAVVRQRIRRHRHRLFAHRPLAQHRTDPAVRADSRRRAARPQSRFRPGVRHAADHRRLELRLPRVARPFGEVDAMNGRLIASWSVVALCGIYFLAPLIATFEFSLRLLRGHYSFEAYRLVFASGDFQSAFLFSAIIGVVTIIVGALIVTPTAYWVQLRLPALRGIVEYITLLPLVVPAIVLVFGYIKLYGSNSILPLTSTPFGSNILLMLGYVALGLPYLYRAIDAGMRSIDVKTLSEAAQIQGAGFPTILFRIIIPNIRSSILSGAFLTFAIVIGEFTLASLLDRPAFGPYLQLVGASRAYEPAALAVVAFLITWGCMGIIQWLGNSGSNFSAKR